MTFTEQPPDLEKSSMRICATGGCDNPLPITANNFRKYCDEHFVGKNADGPGSTKKQRGRPRKEVPPKVVFEIGSKTQIKDQKTQQIKRVAMVPALTANVLRLKGDQQCANVVASQAIPWAASVVDLAEYEPWLKKMLEGGETSGRATAWMGVALMTTTMLLPILAHHNLLPEWVGTLVGGVFVAAQQFQSEDEATAV